MQNALHFVGFKDERVHAALAAFGQPDFWHRVWDERARAEVVEGDEVVFATDDETQPLKKFTWNDSERF